MRVISGMSDREARGLARIRIHEGEQTRVYFHHGARHGSPILVITFDPMYVVDDPATRGFGEDFLIEAGYDVVAVRKTQDNWYQDLSLEDLAATIAALPHRYERIFTYGSSMGAYAATYFAGAVDAQAIALSPLSSIDPAYRAHVTNRDTQRHPMDIRHLRLGESLARTRGPHLVLYDPVRPFDRIYVEQEIAPYLPPGSALVRQRHFGHPTIAVLSQMRVLKQMVTRFIEHGTVPPHHWGPARRRSARFLENIASFLQEGRRHQAAAWALGQAVALRGDQEPGLRIKHAQALAGLSRYDEAVAQARNAVALMPGNASFHSALASHLVRAGQLAEALAAVEQALLLAPQHPRFAEQRAKILARLGRSEDAAAPA